MFEFLNISHPAKGQIFAKDSGWGQAQIESLLETAGPYLTGVCLTGVTAALSPHVEEKINRYQAAGVEVLFGPELFSLALAAHKLEDYTQTLVRMQIDSLLIGEMAGVLPEQMKAKYIGHLSQSFAVYSVVHFPPEVSARRWVEQVHKDLLAGAHKVVLPDFSRVWQTLGPDGLEDLCALVPVQDLAFGAPVPEDCKRLLAVAGPKANFWDVPFEAVLEAQSLRCGYKPAQTLPFSKAQSKSA